MASVADRVLVRPFGRLPDGQEVSKYTMTNDLGMVVTLCDYGASLNSVLLLDRNGNHTEVVRGYDSFEGCVADPYYCGSAIGRFANRISGAQFRLDGRLYQLIANDRSNHLHGGKRGFNKYLWRTTVIENETVPQVRFERLSRDGEEGYPGNLYARVTYTLDHDNRLTVSFEASTDAPTIVNLSLHPYFNLADGEDTDVLNHQLQIYAEAYLPIDRRGIPVGEIRSVASTPMDFRSGNRIGGRIADDNEQLKNGGGYDHFWIIEGAADEPRLAASLTEPESGRGLDIYTTATGLQFYSGNFLEGANGHPAASALGFRQALSLEPQGFPDAPNRPEFPSAVLYPDQMYLQTIVYHFQPGVR